MRLIKRRADFGTARTVFADIARKGSGNARGTLSTSAVHLGLSIKTEVLVVFDKETQHFEARCYDFDRKHPIQVCGPDVLSLQKALDAEFHAALKKAFPKEPLMQPHLLVKLSLVPNLPEKSSSPAAEKMPMLPRCCSARAFMRSEK